MNFLVLLFFHNSPLLTCSPFTRLMSSPQPAKATWNVWGKSTVPTLRAAPVVLFDESSRKCVQSQFRFLLPLTKTNEP